MAEAVDVTMDSDVDDPSDDSDDSSDSDEFPDDDPTFNRYSVAVVKRCKKKLLKVQWKALEKLQEWFNKDDPPVALVCMPTGSGKTGIICCLPYFLGKEGLREVQGKFPEGNARHRFDKPVLIIAPNKDISNQLEARMLTQSKDSNFFLRHGIVKVKKKKKSGKKKNEEKEALPSGLKIEDTKKLRGTKSADTLRGNDVIIANVQKFVQREKWEQDLPDDLFKLVIVDEAHHFPAMTWKRIITKFQVHALVVFFTATPFRGDKKTVVPKPFAYHLELQVAIDEGIIRDTDFVEETTFSLPDSFQFRSELSQEELIRWEVYWAILKKVKEIQERKDKLSLLPNNVPHMAFAITKEKTEANIVADLWNAYFKDAPAITYHSDDEDTKSERMEEILGNKVRLVVVVDMLQEGFDHPPVSIAAIMTKITSPVKFVQFIGRAQRIARRPKGKVSDTIKVKADIVTHSYFQQRENYKKFRSEELLVIQE